MFIIRLTFIPGIKIVLGLPEARVRGLPAALTRQYPITLNAELFT